jgi:hypothetical protein
VALRFRLKTALVAATLATAPTVQGSAALRRTPLLVVTGAVQGAALAIHGEQERERSETSIAKDLRFYEWRSPTQAVLDGFASLRARGYDAVIFEVGGVVDASEQADPVAARGIWQVQMHRLVEAAVANGLRVHAVSGDPGWVHPDRQYVATLLATEIAAWNRSEPAALQFQSLQFDVEPPQDSQYGQSVKALLRLVADAAAVPGVPSIEIAVPARVAEIEVDDAGRTGASALGDVCRQWGIAVEIMAYRDQPDGEDGAIAIVERVRQQLGPNVHIRIAQEVGPPVNDTARTTHADKGRTSLVRSLRRFESMYGADPLVDGFDVNDARGLIALN